MKIAVVGAGAIGGYLAARLAARAGVEVTVVARGRNLAAIAADGLRLRLPDGSEEHAPPGATLRAVADTARAGPQDAVLLAVKAHQLASLLPALPALFDDRTAVVSFVNGVPWWYFHALPGQWRGMRLASLDPDGAIAASIAAERVIGGVVYPAAELVAPGVVRVVEGHRFTIGEPSGERSDRVVAISQALMAAGFKAPVARDIRSEIWVKLWGNLAFNPLSALTHATLEQICRHCGTRETARRMMTEAQAVAEKLGVAFKIDVDQRIAGAEAVGAHKTSMLQDVEAGRETELQALLGAVVELARITATPTPTIDAVHGAAALLGATLQAQRARIALLPVDAG